MDFPLRKVTAKVDLKPASPRPKSRPPSPPKNTPRNSPTSPSLSSFRPRAKVNTDAAVRKLASSSFLVSSQTRNAPPSRSRPGSPFKPPRTLPFNGSEPNGSPKASVMSRSASRGPVQLSFNSLEPRQRALTSASAKLKLPHFEDRPRSGSVVALHHAVSLSDINISPSPSPTLSRPPLSAELPLVETRRANTPPVLAPVKIKSKVSNLVKAASMNPGDAVSRSLSPPYATTRPIHSRTRAPSITSSFSLNDPSPSAFYPITAGSPAANPHRYTPLRASSPAHYPSPTLPNELQPTRKSILIPKVDPTSVPLPPHSPPISALSFSSKSSVSRTSASLNTDQTSDNQTSSVLSHFKQHSADRISHTNAFFSQSEINAQPRQDRSRSRERSPRDPGSDAESDGPERQLRAEAKTNRKIADLEITNRSLLAINASLETTKNRQAKEIRDLRRKLRESRLILPPRTYRAVTSTSPLEDDKEDEDEDECDDDSDAEEGDETFQRVSGLIDSLIESGKNALEMRPEDFRASLATKVLNADELRSWRDSGQRSMRSNYMDNQDADDKTTHGILSPARVAMPDSDGTSSDGELASDSKGSSSLPPITITHSL